MVAGSGRFRSDVGPGTVIDGLIDGEAATADRKDGGQTVVRGSSSVDAIRRRQQLLVDEASAPSGSEVMAGGPRFWR